MARILIADDSEAIRLVLKDILNIENHEIVGEAADGNEAVKKFLELKPDVLLLDLAMPKKDGLSVVKEIISRDSQAKIILITASDNQKIINDCLNAGATAFISKPFEFSDVLKVITNSV